MKQARRVAAEQGRPLKDVIGEALRAGFGLLGRSRKAAKFALTVVGGRGLQPGVRLDDRDALFDLMEGR